MNTFPSYPILPVEGRQSALEGFIQPDPTRPWYTERASVIEYDLPATPAGDSQTTIELVIDKTKTGNFTPRSLHGFWGEIYQIGNLELSYQIQVRAGSWTQDVFSEFEFDLELPPSIGNIYLYPVPNAPIPLGFIPWQYLNLRVSNLPVPTHSRRIVQGSAHNFQFCRSDVAFPVTIIDNIYGNALFSSALITAAGDTTLTSQDVGLMRAFEVHIPSNSTLATAGNNRIQLLNGPDVIWSATPYIPSVLTVGPERVYSVRLPSPINYTIGVTLSIATAFTAGGVEVTGWA